MRGWKCGYTRLLQPKLAEDRWREKVMVRLSFERWRRVRSAAASCRGLAGSFWLRLFWRVRSTKENVTKICAHQTKSIHQSSFEETSVFVPGASPLFHQRHWYEFMFLHWGDGALCEKNEWNVYNNIVFVYYRTFLYRGDACLIHCKEGGSPHAL